jgi:outer membrane receptor protein involved in Fe transport
LRIEHTALNYDNRTSSDTVGRFQRPADRRDTFLTVTPKLGLVYAPNERVAFYISAARGARAPQTAELYRLQNKQVVGGNKPETLDSVELGARGVIRDIQFELALFAMKKRHFFFRDADGFNVPDGKTRHRGFEWNVAVPVFPWAEIASGGTYARHAYDFSRPVSSSATEVISKGDDVDTAPHLLVNTRLMLKPTRAIRAELEWEHVGAYLTDAANAHTYPGHDLFNLRLSATMPRGIELYGAVRNLTNTDYAERADFAFGTERYFPGENRNYMVGLSVKM